MNIIKKKLKVQQFLFKFRIWTHDNIVHPSSNNFYKSKSKLTSLCQYINHKSLNIGVKINYINTQNITAKISLIKNCLII